MAKIGGNQPHFLPGLTDGGCRELFTGLLFATRRVDLAGSKTALFANQKQRVAAPQKTEHGMVIGLKIGHGKRDITVHSCHYSNMEREGQAGKPAAPESQEAIRPEEIISEIYGRIHALREAGRSIRAIVLPIDLYRILQRYRVSLGDHPAGMPDYLGKYDLFGVPLYTEGGDTIVIKTDGEANADDE